MPKKFALPALLSLCLILPGGAALNAAESPGKKVPLENADFEADLVNWKVAKSGAKFVQASPQAGREGKGVRVEDTDTTLNARITSDKVPAKPGKTYEVIFHARHLRGDDNGVGGFLAFYDAEGKRLDHDPDSGHHKDIGENKEWTAFKLNATAPAAAVALVVEIRSNKVSVISADFDDFAVYELP